MVGPFVAPTRCLPDKFRPFSFSGSAQPGQRCLQLDPSSLSGFAAYNGTRAQFRRLGHPPEPGGAQAGERPGLARVREVSRMRTGPKRCSQVLI